MPNLTAEQIIIKLVETGAIIESEKKEESNSCLAKRVVLKRGECKIKVDYVKIGDHEILVQNSCSCTKCGQVSKVPEKCFK